MDYSKDQNIKKRKKNKTNNKRLKNKGGALFFRTSVAIFLIASFAIFGAFAGAYIGIIKNAPELDVMNVEPSIYPSVIVDQNGIEIEQLTGTENRKYVELAATPQNLQDAFVAIEDERFYQHNGVDIKGTTRAIWVTLTSDEVQGGSTITQQVIKNNVAGIPKNSVVTKLQEQYLAVQYEKELTEVYGSKKAAKDHILEVYMNTVSMHYSMNGVQTAANYYFAKDVSQLTLSECAVIAGITKNPSKYEPINHQAESRERQVLVLDKMLELGMITQEEYTEAINDDVYARVSANETVTTEKNSIHSYFVDAVMEDVVEDLGEQGMLEADAYNLLYNGGLRIEATIDTEMQKIMDESFMNDDLYPAGDFEIDVQYSITVTDGTTGKVENFYEVGKVQSEEEIQPWVEATRPNYVDEGDTYVESIIPVPQPQAAMVVIDYHTGQVKAISGGRGEKTGSLTLNRATNSLRQPGSTFKVLASYAPGIDMEKITAATVIDDAPYTVPGSTYSPSNWYGGYRGPSTVRKGIVDSMNVITVKNMVDVGVEECFQYLLNFGFTSLVEEPIEINGEMKTDVGPATCLGGLTWGVSQLELAAAYGTIANGGVYIEPTFYTEVYDHDGNLILEPNQDTHRVLKEESAYILTDIMKDVLTEGTGGKAKLRNTDMATAGKTGTTTDTYDLMFAGYTPYYVGSVWMGFDKPKTITQDHGYHMYLWRDVMEKIHQDLPVEDFEKPEGVVTASMCRTSGKGPIDACSSAGTVFSEIFITGTEPASLGSCDVHVTATIDIRTKKRAGPNCPSEFVQTVTGVREGYYPEGSENKQHEIPDAWINGPVCDEILPKGTDSPTSYIIDPITGELKEVPSPDLNEPNSGTSTKKPKPQNTPPPPVITVPTKSPQTVAPPTAVPIILPSDTPKPVPPPVIVPSQQQVPPTINDPATGN